MLKDRIQLGSEQVSRLEGWPYKPRKRGLKVKGLIRQADRRLANEVESHNQVKHLIEGETKHRIKHIRGHCEWLTKLLLRGKSVLPL